MDNVRTMKFLGVDAWGRPVYKCKENDYLWKDITLGSKDPQLYSTDDIDGEPDSPIRKDLEIRFI